MVTLVSMLRTITLQFDPWYAVNSVSFPWKLMIQSVLCLVATGCHPWICINSMVCLLLCFWHYFPLLALTELEAEWSQHGSCQRTQWHFSSHLDQYTVHCTLGLSWRPHCTVSHACKRECCLFQSGRSDGTKCTLTIWTDSSIFPSKVHVSCTFRQLITLRSSYQNDHLRIKILVSQVMDTSGIITYQPFQVAVLW